MDPVAAAGTGGERVDRVALVAAPPEPMYSDCSESAGTGAGAGTDGSVDTHRRLQEEAIHGMSIQDLPELCRQPQQHCVSQPMAPVSCLKPLQHLQPRQRTRSGEGLLLTPDDSSLLRHQTPYGSMEVNPSSPYLDDARRHLHHPQHSLQHHRKAFGVNFADDLEVHHAGGEGAAAGTISHLRRSQTVGHSAHYTHHPHAEVNLTNMAPHPGSLIERLQLSFEADPPSAMTAVGRGPPLPPLLRRNHTSPAATSQYSAATSTANGISTRNNIGVSADGSLGGHALGTSHRPLQDPAALTQAQSPLMSQHHHPRPLRTGYEVTFGPSEASRTAAAVAAAEQAVESRPFGFLGVTRPPWTTRWEAHLLDEASGERIFLGNFDALESAARAYDAAALKLYGEGACGDLNFDANDYLTTLAEMSECTFEEFVKSLVCHSFGSVRQQSRYRGVHIASDGRWEARLEEHISGKRVKP